MTTTPFEHSPLDPADPRAIQILELLPSRNLKGPIRCELHHHSLDEDVQYEALSYTWGDPESGHTVFVNGPHALDVTPNCLEALTCLRRRFHRRSLWVDAICIDQRENDTSKRERDRQVRIMGDIYHVAQKVLVWLGPAEPSTARTMARLKTIDKLYVAKRSAKFGSSVLDALERSLSNRMSDLSPAPRERYEAFASMIRSPWWSRVWTLQEQALASKCEAHHGRQSIPLTCLSPKELLDSSLFLTDGEWFHNHGARDLIRSMCDLNCEYPRDRDFVVQRLLEMAFLLEAKHPIDKLYGLYSILTAYCKLPLSAPDYDKTAECVYEETVWAWIKTRGDLSILKLAARPCLVQRLPSWVPAWHQQHPSLIRNIGRSSLEGLQMKSSDLGHFDWNYAWSPYSGNLETSVDLPGETEDHVSVATVLSHGNLRVLRARFAGRVSHAIGPDRSHEVDWYYSSIQSLYVHLDWCKLIHDVFLHGSAAHEEALQEMYRSLSIPGIHQFEGSNDTVFESFQTWFDFMLYLNEASGLPTLISGRTDTERSQGSGVQLYFDICMACEEVDAADVLERGYGGDAQGREGLIKLAQHIRSTRGGLVFVRNHSLCILDKDNMIAVTDYWCQEGDEVFVFPGTDSPFVLRKQPDGDCYRLVGPALVDRLFRVGYQEWRSEGDDLQDIVLI